VKVRLCGDAERVGPLVRTSVTGTVNGELVAPGAVMVMVPGYVSAARLPAFMLTVIVPGVVPEDVADNQPPPFCVVLATVYATFELPAAVTEID